MIINCPKCEKRYKIDPDKIPKGGKSVNCRACGSPIALSIPNPDAAVCPKCGYERKPNNDTATPQTECPQCGVIYEKHIAFVANKKAEEKAKKLAQKQVEEEAKKKEKELELASEKARQEESLRLKKPKNCPFCGEEILAIAKKCKHCGEFMDGTSGGAVRKEATGPEKTVWSGHPSPWCYMTYWILGVLLTPIGIGLLIIVYAILDQQMRVYTLTTRKAMAKIGIISRNTNEVALKDIRSINMDQPLLQRAFGLGSIMIGSAGTGGVEVTFKGVKHPAKLRDQIRETKEKTGG